MASLIPMIYVPACSSHLWSSGWASTRCARCHQQSMCKQALSKQNDSKRAALWNNLGHFSPCRRSGNTFGTTLRGQDLIYLAIYRVAYPNATAEEVHALLYRMNYRNVNFWFYIGSQISAFCSWKTNWYDKKKGGSYVTWQAFLPINIRKVGYIGICHIPWG